MTLAVITEVGLQSKNQATGLSTSRPTSIGVAQRFPLQDGRAEYWIWDDPRTLAINWFYT